MPVALVARVFDTQANQSFDVTFERFPVRIGRNQLNDLPIDRPYVSQFHAAIDVRNDRQIFVKDLGSTNGTLFQSQRLARETPVEITATPEITIGPIVIRIGLVAAQAKPAVADGTAGLLDFGEHQQQPVVSQHFGRVAPGAEDPYVRQVVPYVEAYRQAWQTVYRVIYDHLSRLPNDVRTNYLRRLGLEHPALSLESDFRKIAQYYQVDMRVFTEAGPGQAALAAIGELAQTLAPGLKPPDDVQTVLAFAKRLRDSMDVFLKCFCSLRDGYQEFEKEMLARENVASDPVASAKDAKELGNVLLGNQSTPDTARQLHDIFVEVMSHQVALLNGIMEGVKQLLVKLSPKTIEAELERAGKGGGMFGKPYDRMWKHYEVRHADYAGEDKETFLIIFGPQFSRAYTATAGEDYKTDKSNKLGRFTMAGGVPRPPRD
ncbi:MAG: type VI secretion system-associated FHA domain protein [Polyangiaceae bacterium]